jgi:N-acetylglutamate synthase-like GNAT family acetyltransferase
MSIIYTRARKHNIQGILDLIQPYVEAGAVLPRTTNDILEHLDNFFVAKVIKDGQTIEERSKVVGCVALRDFGDGLEEIRTLCVHADYAGQGVASHLIDMCFDLAIGRDSKEIFALSLRPTVFMRKGFHNVAMNQLPDKVWKDDQVSSPDEKAVILATRDSYLPE